MFKHVQELHFLCAIRTKDIKKKLLNMRLNLQIQEIMEFQLGKAYICLNLLQYQPSCSYAAC